MLRKLLKRTLLLIGLVAASVMTGCAGVTPSIEVGIGHTPPGEGELVSADEAIAWAWSFGGTLKASFADTGVILEPCGAVSYTGVTAETGEGTSTTVIPGTFCIEFDTAKIRN